jgi:hypothetical protein
MSKDLEVTFSETFSGNGYTYLKGQAYSMTKDEFSAFVRETGFEKCREKLWLSDESDTWANVKP